MMDELSLAASRALGNVIGKTCDNYDLSYNCYSRLYEACVVPIMTYGAGTWGTRTNCSKLDKIQYRAIHYFCGLPRKTPILGLAGDIGWIPCVIRRDLELLRMFNQIVRMTDDRILMKILKYDRELNGEWSMNIKNLLCNIEETKNWESFSAVNIKQARAKLMQLYEEVWLDEIQGKPKLRTYTQHKVKFETEPHLRVNIPK